MKTFPKIDRRVWIALDMQERRRKRMRGGQSFLLPAPVLRAAYPDLLQWDWSLANPYKWNVWMSLDNGASWTLIEDYWTFGNGRQFAPDGGHELYFIVGVDAAGNEITSHSNVVRPDDAVPPVPLSVLGLQLWNRVESLAGLTNGSPVATWPDESGHETHLAQATSGSQPVYRVNTIGQPSVQFDGFDDVMTSVASVFKPDNHTIFIVARPDSVSENDLIGTGGTSDGDMLLMLFGNRQRGHAWREGDANVIDGDSWLHSGDLAVFEQSVSTGGIAVRLSGADDGSMGVTGNGANTRKWVKLGSRDTGSNFKGHILAVLVYDRALTAMEANTVRQYLIDTYAVPTPYPPLTFHTSLAGYWKLDEYPGETRFDASGNGWDLQEWSFAEAESWGTAEDSEVPAGSGFFGNSAAFVYGPGQGLVSFVPNTLLDGDFSFSCWINFNSDDGFDGQGLISLGGTVQMGVRAYDNALNFVVYTDTSPGAGEATTGYESIAQNTWTHAVFVKESNTLRIYINGVEQAYADYAGNIVPAGAGFFGPSDLILGINPWGYPLVGMVDEVGCWSRALSSGEVEALYQFGNGLPYESF